MLLRRQQRMFVESCNFQLSSSLLKYVYAAKTNRFSGFRFIVRLPIYLFYEIKVIYKNEFRAGFFLNSI